MASFLIKPELSRIQELDQSVPEGPWFWGGNTDHIGDVVLCGSFPRFSDHEEAHLMCASEIREAICKHLDIGGKK